MVLKQAIALAENSLDDAKKEHARISQEKAEATAELGETEAAKAADETTLNDVPLNKLLKISRRRRRRQRRRRRRR